MKVFSTLRSDQIDISRHLQKGLPESKLFLEYTEKGKRALPQKNTVKKTKPKFFEKMVAEEIKNWDIRFKLILVVRVLELILELLILKNNLNIS